MQEEFVHAMTGMQNEIRSGEDEKLLFGKKFSDCTNGSADYDILYAFQEKALEVLESADTDEVKVTPDKLGTMLKESGIEEEQAEAFVKSMEDVKELNLGNLVDKSKMTIHYRMQQSKFLLSMLIGWKSKKLMDACMQRFRLMKIILK